MVGVRGFEPPASTSRNYRSWARFLIRSSLRHIMLRCWPSARLISAWVVPTIRRSRIRVSSSDNLPASLDFSATQSGTVTSASFHLCVGEGMSIKGPRKRNDAKLRVWLGV
jgi:hypothetical protein